ncbi:MAG: UDP-2,3-diacylglucosamine diphosphatase [Candidatus Kapabacteria bacterium]|nr:UDP-2,3-diacylglucosamine diphosphatase [Candidatus Kapabacteria bacterium]
MLSPVVSVTDIVLDVHQGKSVAFLSDVHLGYGARQDDRQREDRLLSVLRNVSQMSSHIVIVGDLFDYWFDYGTVVPSRFVRTLSMLHDLADAGIELIYLMGNHDFGHYRYFEEELKIPVILGDVSATIGSKRFYIAHGDGKAHNDAGYLVLRAVLRNRFAQWMYRKLHPDLGIALASRTSHGSRDLTGARDYGQRDGLRDFAEARLAEGYDVVVMGHRHVAEVTPIGSGLYVNLGHWLGHQPTYATYDIEKGLVLRTVTE